MLISKFCLLGVVCPCPGAIYMYKSMKKSECQEIFLKFATNGQSDKAFLLTSKFCPSSGAIYMYKIMKKNVYKIRLHRDLFETCNKWLKWQEVSVDIKFWPQEVVCHCPRDIYMYKTMKNVPWPAGAIYGFEIVKKMQNLSLPKTRCQVSITGLLVLWFNLALQFILAFLWLSLVYFISLPNYLLCKPCSVLF